MSLLQKRPIILGMRYDVSYMYEVYCKVASIEQGHIYLNIYETSYLIHKIIGLFWKRDIYASPYIHHKSIEGIYLLAQYSLSSD